MQRESIYSENVKKCDNSLKTEMVCLAGAFGKDCFAAAVFSDVCLQASV